MKQLLSLTALALLSCGSDHGHSHPHPHGAEHGDGDQGHEHEEVSLGKAMVGDLEVELAQGHGAVEPGKECHLVVKLPFSDEGATVVRAWIGTEDRTASRIGKADYAPAHDDYDVHAVAPEPLPDGALWWIELEKPDGTKMVGSATPLTE